MKNSIIYTLCVVLLVAVLSCSREEPANTITEIEEVNLDQNEPLTISEINQIIESEIELNGDFDWSTSSELVLWSALQHSEGILTIGYGTDQNDFVVDNTGKQSSSKNTIVEMVRMFEGRA